MMSTIPDPDRQVMADPEKQQAFVAAVREALRQGPRGAHVDAALGVRPWGFRTSEIAIPVCVWHGEADQNAPLAMGHSLARAIPDCRASFYPDAGHLSLIVHHAQDILGELAATAHDRLVAKS